jgi:Protein of unknown function (DUF2505)
MRKPTASHTIDCDIDTFWKVFWEDEAFSTKLYLEELGFKECELLERTDTFRRIRLVPKMNLPRPVVKVLGDRFGYEDHATLDRAKNELRWEMKPNTMADKLIMRGTIRVEPAGDNRCRRSDEVSIEAKMFGVGKLIESSTEGEVRSAWSTEAAFLNRYVRSL